MLWDLYKTQSKSINQIAKLLGYAGWSIRRRLILNRIALRSRGGDNRSGKRKLAEVSNIELALGSPRDLAEKYSVHVATIFAEKRLRKGNITQWNSALSPPPDTLTDGQSDQPTISSSHTSSKTPSTLNSIDRDQKQETPSS